MEQKKEKDGSIIVDGIRYVPENNLRPDEQLPTEWNQLVKKYLNESGTFIRLNGEISSHRIEEDKPFVFLNPMTAHAFLFLKQLIEFRRAYNGKWKCDWNDEKQNKYSIVMKNKKLFITSCTSRTSSMLIFKSESLAKLFVKNFESELQYVFNALYN